MIEFLKTISGTVKSNDINIWLISLGGISFCLILLLYENGYLVFENVNCFLSQGFSFFGVSRGMR